jgi:succinate-semialdehyde dehydrogenase/glutarate-semialdehyde dehydrogenase
MEAVNPATGELIASYEETTDAEVDAALDAAVEAFDGWRRRSFGERAALLTAAAATLRDRRRAYAEVITGEMGKPITQAEAEVEKCAWVCDFYAENAGAMLCPEPIASDATESHVAFPPLGPVLAVMPWNFPFWQLFRFAAPALMAGNVAILKHAGNVPGCALAIEDAFTAAGLPTGVFRTLLVGSDRVAGMIADPRVAAVTLTGSEAAGVSVGGAAGSAIKPAVLELGGSDPYIVLADADVAEAAAVAVTARNQNAGQSCIAAKRFIVDSAVAEEFVARFAEGVAALSMGDPMDPETQVGPMARGDLRDALAAQVSASIAAGAAVRTGGWAEPGPGFYYAPTVLTGVTAAMPAWREETFGPVAAVATCDGADQAVALANDTPFGLGASLWTADIELGRRLASEIQAGSVFINGMVASDPRLPFGGVKRSGYGRELSGFGIREFVNVQTVWVGPRRSPGPVAQAE